MNKVEIHKKICNQLNSLYAKKNQDYGDSFAKLRKEYGNPAILIRLEDKLGRLKRLMMGAESELIKVLSLPRNTVRKICKVLELHQEGYRNTDIILRIMGRNYL